MWGILTSVNRQALTTIKSVTEHADLSEELIRVPSRTKRGVRARRVTFSLCVAILVYSAVIGLVPLPRLPVHLAGAANTSFLSTDVQIAQTLAQRSEAQGIAWVRDGEVLDGLRWINSDDEIPIASLTKLITVLVGLQQQSLAGGGEGVPYVTTEKDRDLLEEVWKQNGSWEDVFPGQKLSTRQMIELMLLPSANNYAISYANWVFGDNAKFVAATKSWLSDHGLTHTHVYEPSGLDERNRSTVSDLITLGAIALKHPLIVDITKQTSGDSADW